MCDEDHDIDPDASPDHPDAPEPPTHGEYPELQMRIPSGNPRIYWR